MHLFHLSHTDLDGYSCQVITDHFFEKKNFYNSNYGPEVTAKINKIENDIKQLSGKRKSLILITDLNITPDECALLDKIVTRLNFLGKEVEVQLLDHHGSGEKQSKEYKWYFLDTSRSATKITYDYFLKNYKPIKELHPSMKDYVDAVNAYDLWNMEEEGFEFGKVLNRVCVDSKELSGNIFPVENFEYRKHNLQSSFDYFEGGRYVDFDDSILSQKKKFLGKGEKKDTIDNLVASYIIELLNKNKENMTVHIMDYKGILTNAIGNSSVLGNAFLKANPDYDFFLDIGNSGNVSLRSDGKVDVSKIAAKFFNGGGHPNASGGRVQGIKEIYIYTSLKRQIEDKFGS